MNNHTGTMSLLKRLALCWRILRARPSNLLAHAERELPPADGDPIQELINCELKELILVFCTHGHSGFSASYEISLLTKLLRLQPVGPLTGEDTEWNEVDPGRLWQNRRCSRVFKDADGRAYDIEGIVFREPSGACFTNGESHVDVAFPYVPQTRVVDREPSAN